MECEQSALGRFQQNQLPLCDSSQSQRKRRPNGTTRTCNKDALSLKVVDHLR